MDDLIAKVIETVEPPRGKTWNQEPWAGIYELLFGAAVCLCASRYSIEQRLERGKEYEQARPQLWRDLKRMFSGGATQIQWEQFPFSQWSNGMFLNKAESNVASALDRHVNCLILAKIEGKGKEDFQYAYITARASLVTELNYPKQIRHFASQLKTAVEGGHQKSVDLGLLALAEECESVSDLHSIVGQMRFKVSPSDSAAAIWQQFNLWKHHEKGTFARRPEYWPDAKRTTVGRVSLIEWALTFSALQFASEFWRTSVRSAQSKNS